MEEEAVVDQSLLAPLRKTTWRFYALVVALLAVVGWGAYAYSWQIRSGLSVTGLTDRVSWGLYISNMVFFIGISYGGTLISGILRLTHAEWRRPITRLAETTTVMALLVAVVFPVLDLGRPDRALNLLLYRRIESPIVWDFLGIFTYLGGALLYLYLPLIPDLGIVRREVKVGRVRGFMYRVLGGRWTGTRLQKKSLETSIGIIAVLIIPVAISVHTVMSWIFAMTLRSGWHSAILGPYFVAGAIFSGIAAVIIAMAIFRRVYHLEKYITVRHFRNLGALLLVLDLVVIYFTLSEYLTAAYGAESQDVLWLKALATGGYAYLFWLMVVGGFIVPAILLALRRTITGIVLASVLVSVAMWLERFLIVVPTLMTPQMGSSWNLYTPSWVEWSITAAGLAGFALLCAVFSKLFPIVSMWETSEGTAPAGEPQVTEEELPA
ncbi:MAG: NrfD/PsrC family molybdoenzyme membrane anchor subunit [Thermoplasmata archaeon]